ncbi:MAG: M55 family metallopeptidase [Bacillota bacterium]|nr:M55 family metallopeptidase [Bacillota bacterium]
MNIYVMVDAEGLSGIHLKEQVMSDGRLFQEFRQAMTDEINACVAGLKAGGAGRVMVRDAHASGNNVLWSQLSDDADGYIMGDSDGVRMPGLDDYDAVVLLGYHAMAGTHHAVLEHTMSSRAWQNCWINGSQGGEVAIDAAIAGEQGKPVILVTGDDKVCAEAKACLPGVITAVVKQALSVEGAIHLPRGKAYELIRQKSADAVSRAKNTDLQPMRVEHPVTLRLELVERGKVPNQLARPDVRQIDGRTYEVTAESVEAALYRL